MLVRRLLAVSFLLVAGFLGACGPSALTDGNTEETAAEGNIKMKTSSGNKTLYWYMGTWFKIPKGHLPYTSGEWEPIENREKYILALSENASKTGYDIKTGTFNSDLLDVKPLPRLMTFCSPGIGEISRKENYDPTNCEEHQNNVVSMRIEWPFLESTGDTYSSIFRKLDIATKKIEKSRETGEPTFWETINSKDGWDPGSDSFTTERVGQDIDILIHCAPGRNYSEDKQRQCHGIVWEKSSRLAISLSFAGAHGKREADDHWEAPVKEALELAKSMRVED